MNPTATQYRQSWLTLHASYESECGRGANVRFRYIVKRLLDSPASQQFTIGEAFLFAYAGEERDLRTTPLEELYARHAAASQRHSFGRGLFFTTACHGVELHKTPHVVVYTSDDAATLYARYCRGHEVVQSHICQPRKEIPCILSLLQLLKEDTQPASSGL